MPIRWNKSAIEQLKKEAENHVSDAAKRAHAAAARVEGTNQKVQAFSNELKKAGIEPDMNTVRKLFRD